MRNESENELDLFGTGSLPPPKVVHSNPEKGSASKRTIQEKFEAFHRDNPWVYEAIEKLANQLVARGHKKLGMKMIWEVLRWKYLMFTTGSDGFKLSNNFTSRYARLLISRRPDLEGRFDTKELKAP